MFCCKSKIFVNWTRAREKITKKLQNYKVVFFPFKYRFLIYLWQHWILIRYEIRIHFFPLKRKTKAWFWQIWTFFPTFLFDCWLEKIVFVFWNNWNNFKILTRARTWNRTFILRGLSRVYKISFVFLFLPLIALHFKIGLYWGYYHEKALKPIEHLQFLGWCFN